ncbi:hypothetical protein ACWT_5864 [Actinoplanes sp. SE50]|uniref:hypothetical protein n=1 Tax=unclassified Actinoplanes TaxID=2626549 RepID=UPI00023EBDD4|nr:MULTISPECIES: hypothetical protein [unclassified Actinoplanes]AEV86882.1 hypothetical protein ACPL_5995 [Actinoplanes sp. SE50/110]ATO85279.1 hypothetical protein ACWT_5864 [Actinoplanes sp. SE50]SLM02689.1 hypothetical protein ACSP50_5971 [Actinoplanes sp. SE50/110]
MSAYANDPRVNDVTGRGTLFLVADKPDGEPVARVRPFIDGATWVAWPVDENLMTELPEFGTADEAIRSVIGDPQ